ncbi:MAG: hypothetical protein E7379_00155 [Clostridiales bacterium]|nr:hypothetical protein [Clostridiales bacterium]
MDESEIVQSITEVLMSFKFQTDINGFEYLRSAILLCYQDEELKNNISKKVYPMVAEMHNSNAQTVERGMRTAIENCYNSGGLLEINEVFGLIVYKNDFKWTNGEMISLFVEILKIKEKRQLLNEKLLLLKGEIK